MSTDPPQSFMSLRLQPKIHRFLHFKLNTTKVAVSICQLPSSLCRHDYAAGAANSSGNSWRPRLSGGSGAGVKQEQSASTDQGRLVAVVFSATDKGPSVSAVVQLTSDYCTIV